MIQRIVIIVFSLAVCSSCVQTRTLPMGKTLFDLPYPDYMGTFSAISFLKDKQKIEIDNELSMRSVYLTDSLVKARVGRINPQTPVLDSLLIKRLREELIKTVNHVKENGSIGNVAVDSIFRKAGEKTKGNYNLYFISTGFIKDSVLRKKAINREIASSVAAFVGGLAGYYVYRTSDPSLPSGQQGGLDFHRVYEGTKGLRGFIVIYDKKNDKICFYREQFFSENKDPLLVKSICKQLKYIFRENYK